MVGKPRDEDTDDQTGEVSAIYLLPEFLSKGYGKKLMDFGIGRLKALGYTRAVLWVLRDNPRARTFYEKYGFVPDGAERTHHHRRPACGNTLCYGAAGKSISPEHYSSVC